MSSGLQLSIRSIDLDGYGLGSLPHEARSEGFAFVDRLIGEWASGRNRFSEVGELFGGIFDGEQLLGFGGLNRDPYAGKHDVGRIRHFYVKRCWRRLGVGRQLLVYLLRHATQYFSLVRLRAGDEAAARFYEASGFCSFDMPDATHIISLIETSRKFQGESS